MKGIVIAIDGVSGCGKSTTAKAVAKKLSYVYIDTGAMYRAVTLSFLNNNIDLNNSQAVVKALESISISFKHIEGQLHTFLNGVDVEDDIRTLAVSSKVSPVAAIKPVRDKLVELQRTMGLEGSVVMDGRDIGTNVFPNADLKIFMSASPEIRASRRVKELQEKGEVVNHKEVLDNLIERDTIDSSRKESPLQKASDAIEIDTSNLNISTQVDRVISLFNSIV